MRASLCLSFFTFSVKVERYKEDAECAIEDEEDIALGWHFGENETREKPVEAADLLLAAEVGFKPFKTLEERKIKAKERISFSFFSNNFLYN